MQDNKKCTYILYKMVYFLVTDIKSHFFTVTLQTIKVPLIYEACEACAFYYNY